MMTQVQWQAAVRTIWFTWFAVFQLAGCGATSGPKLGPGPNILDEESPFAAAKQPPAATCDKTDRDAAIAAWTKLRTGSYPYHLQAVALSPPFPSGCRALIVAEPPPTVSLDDLRAVAPRLMAGAETQQHTVGYDGWTRDVVVTLPPVTDAELTELIADLHSTLFETTYRMAALDTDKPAPAYDPKTAPLDVGIGPGELRRWLLEDATSFTPLRGGTPVAFKDLLAADRPEVYVDDAHGLVAWIVPRRADIANMAGMFRQFTLESDIIVGALASTTTVAIIARQRAIDPSVLQPLRFETVSLLAAVHDKESLQQSYDRTNLLAGRIDKGRDWAPIFLSPELIDTEYGSVLDIADQCLKSWSNNGKTRYINFGYPDPPHWAFRDPVSIISHAEMFRYNWNTANVGAVIGAGDTDVFWLRRTGALNVSYFANENELATQPSAPQPEMEGLEEKAYQFFVKTQTPILARVVQYNALFQIFARFNISSSHEVPTATYAVAKQTLIAAARDALTMVRRGDETEIKERLSPLKKLVNEIMIHHLSRTLPPELLNGLHHEISSYSRDVLDRFMNRTIADVNALTVELSKLDEDGSGELASLIGDPRGAREIRNDVFPAYKRLQALRLAFPLFAAPGTYKAYAEKIGVRSGSWIHTPSIVISWNVPPTEDGVGGHSLEAKVASLEFHPERAVVAAEEIAANRAIEGVGARELSRLELGPRGPQLATKAVERGARTALGTTQRRGFWPERGRQSVTSGAAPGGMAVTRAGDGYRVVDASGVTHEVTTMPEVVELVSQTRLVNGKDLAIRFEGLRPAEVQRVVRSAETRTRAGVAGIMKSPEFKIRQLDFSRATVRETQIRSYSDGAGEIGHIIEMAGEEAPAAESLPQVAKGVAGEHEVARSGGVTRSKPMSVEVKVAVKIPQSMLERLGAKIMELINKLIRRFSGQAVSPEEFGTALQRELQELLQKELQNEAQDARRRELRDFQKIMIRIRQEASDITIVQREVSASHGSGHLAG